MADRILFISWGTPVRGREEHALEVFDETVGMYGRLLQDGRIDAFDVGLLTPSSDVAGFFEVRGSAEQLAALREDAEWQRSIVDGQLIVEDLRVVDGYVNEGVAQQMSMYQAAVAKVPQRA